MKFGNGQYHQPIRAFIRAIANFTGQYRAKNSRVGVVPNMVLQNTTSYRASKVGTVGMVGKFGSYWQGIRQKYGATPKCGGAKHANCQTKCARLDNAAANRHHFFPRRIAAAVRFVNYRRSQSVRHKYTKPYLPQPQMYCGGR